MNEVEEAHGIIGISVSHKPIPVANLFMGLLQKHWVVDKKVDDIHKMLLLINPHEHTT